MQRFSFLSYDRELPIYEYACIYHRMTMGIEPGSRRYADTQNSDLGLTCRIRRQKPPIPASGSINEFLLDNLGRLVRLRADPNRSTARLQENNSVEDCKDTNGLPKRMLHISVSFLS